MTFIITFNHVDAVRQLAWYGALHLEVVVLYKKSYEIGYSG